MAYANLTPNLQDMFSQINDRLRKLESGPNSAAYSADTAQAVATTAQAQAVTALAQATTAYNAAVQSLQPSASTIVNASYQMTAISTNGITVYSGSSSSSGARVVMNSVGIAGYDSSNNATFAINASTGAASFSGSITGSSITGSTLNISGNFIVNSSGYLTATGATLTGQVNATSGYIGSSSSSGWIINGSYLSDSSATTALYANSGGGGGSSIVTTAGAYIKWLSLNNATIGSYQLAVGGSAYINGSLETTGNLQVDATSTVTYSSSNYNIALLGLGTGGTQAGRFYKTTSVSSKRFKHNIESFVPRDYLNIVNKLNPVAFNYNADIVENPEVIAYGLIAEDVQAIPETEDLVNLDKDNLPESIAYDRLQWYVIKAIQQLTTRITALEAK